MVIAELLQGIKTEKENQQLKRLFQSLHYLKTEDHDWVQAGQLSQQLRNV